MPTDHPSTAALRAIRAMRPLLPHGHSIDRTLESDLARIIDEQTHVGEFRKVLSDLMATYHIADFEGMSNHALAEAAEMAPAPEYRQECAAILAGRTLLAKLQPEGQG